MSILGIIASIYISDFDWNSIEKLNRYSIDKMIPFNWLIDPSGYACDALTGQRLAGARATLYFKASEDGEAEEWDASPYGQQNPLVTDGQGRFSWDVPEGWWQVRIEKEGYASASSDWIRVPSEGEPDLSVPLVPLTAFLFDVGRHFYGDRLRYVAH